MRIRFELGVSGIALLAICASPLSAQSEGQPNETQTTQEAEGIIVTGEKVDRSLQDTITSVGVVTGETIEAQGITTLSEAFDYIANVNLGNSQGGFSIRGIPFDNLLGAGSSPLAQIYVDDVTLSDQSTRFGAEGLWDVSQIEVLRGAQSTVQGRNALAGAIVIRTADPTFYWTGKARAIGFSSDGGEEFAVSGAIGGPIIEDILAFRVSGERRESEGFVSNPITGGTDFENQWNGRVKLLFTPTPDIRSLLTYSYVDVEVADRASDRRSRGPDGFVNFQDVVPGNELNRQSFINSPDFNANTQHNISWKTDWDVSDAVRLTSITTYSDGEINERLDTDATFLNPALFPSTPVIIDNPFDIPRVPTGPYVFSTEGTQFETQTIFTQELIFQYDNGGPLRGLIGAYYVNSKEDEFNFTPGIQPGILDTVAGAVRPGLEASLIGGLGPLRGVAAPGNPVASIPAGPEGDTAFAAFIAQATDLSVAVTQANYADLGTFVAATSEPLDIENYAAYISGEYDILPNLTIGLGLRYDYEEQLEGLTIIGQPLGQPDPAAPFIPPDFPAVLVPGVQGSIQAVNAFFDATLSEASTSATQDFSAWLPSGFVRWEIDDDRSLAFSVRRGYRAGGSDLNIVRQFVSQFDPEFTTNYELAFRSFFFDRKLRLNANAFYIDWTDQQVVVSLSTLQQDEVGFNVGSSTVQGFEIDAYLTPAPGWFVQGVLGYSDTQFNDFDAALAATLIEAQNVLAPIDLEETLSAFEGREFAFAPDWSGAARIGYDDAATGLFGILGVTYEGSSNVNNANSSSPTFLDNDSRVLVNATLGIEFDNLTIALVARNLLDEDYVASGGDELVRLGPQRQIGVRVQAEF
ncbi:MAG: TonB-dependent receptor [Erythrobacter sp.]